MMQCKPAKNSTSDSFGGGKGDSSTRWQTRGVGEPSEGRDFFPKTARTSMQYVWALVSRGVYLICIDWVGERPRMGMMFDFFEQHPVETRRPRGQAVDTHIQTADTNSGYLRLPQTARVRERVRHRNERGWAEPRLAIGQGRGGVKGRVEAADTPQNVLQCRLLTLLMVSTAAVQAVSIRW